MESRKAPYKGGSGGHRKRRLVDVLWHWARTEHGMDVLDLGDWVILLDAATGPGCADLRHQRDSCGSSTVHAGCGGTRRCG